MLNHQSWSKVGEHMLGEPVAGGGLLDRRVFLAGGALLASAATLRDATAGSNSIGDDAPASMTRPGKVFQGYGVPAVPEKSIQRTVLQPYGELAPGAGVAMTPLGALEGTITPNGLHFERSHNGRPTIDPDAHRFLIHGLVKRPLKFTLESLLRYPMVTRTCFIECSGNSFFNSNLFPEPMQVPVGMIHGLVSGAEWTGVPLNILLEETGLDPKGKWILAEGADSAGMSRSIPIEKALDDAIVALYQNGERLRAEQGYPMRLLLPGFEGNMSVKWLRRIKVTTGPTYTKDETSKYSDLMPDGTARLFTFTMGVKSTITRPATGVAMSGPGLYEISGLAWSGHGSIIRVEVSADGGKSWADAALGDPVLPMALTRFRIPWRWDGGPTILQSRATDDGGNTQLRREVWSAQYADGQLYHCNAIQTWGIGRNGEVSNVYI